MDGLPHYFVKAIVFSPRLMYTKMQSNIFPEEIEWAQMMGSSYVKKGG
jgi:hypothetical protein